MDELRGRLWVVLAAVLLVAAFSAQAGPVPAKGNDASKGATLVTVTPAKLAGRVLYSDGKTAVAESPVRVWDVDKKAFIHESVTDEHGAYELPKLPEGRYVVLFGDRVRVDMVVDETKGTAYKPFDVIIPRGRAQLSRDELATQLAKVGPAYPAGGAVKPLTAALIVVGTGALAVGIYEIADNQRHETGRDDDDDTGGRRRRTVVSP